MICDERQKNNLKLVYQTEADKFTKSHNFSMLADLYNGSKLIKYSSRISPQLREIIKDNSLNLINNTNTNTNNNTQSIPFTEGLYKERGVHSSVQIASAIAGYSQILKHKYTNIQIYKYKKIKIYKYTNIQIYKYTKIQI